MSAHPILRLTFFLFCVSFLMCAPVEKLPENNQCDPNPSMQILLERLKDSLSRKVGPWNSSLLLELIDEGLTSSSLSPKERVQLRLMKVEWQLYQGKIERSIMEGQKLAASLPGLRAELQYAFLDSVEMACRRWESLAYIRMGEVQNCIEGTIQSACILPFAEGSLHTYQVGSQNAIRVLEAILRKVPDDYRSRWLLNIAYMTLGRYPEEVPEEYLIDLNFFDRGDSAIRFVNVAKELGVDFLSLAGGAVCDDFDQDGQVDFVASSYSLDEEVAFFTAGIDHPIGIRSGTILEGNYGGINLNQVDYNNDGWLDLYVMRGGWQESQGDIPNSLLRNNQDGTFSDVTCEAGLLFFEPTITSCWGDFNLDGWMDLFIGNEHTASQDSPVYSRLMLNSGDGTFTDVSEQAGVWLNAHVKGTACADYDNDGDLDLFVSVYGDSNYLFRNEGNEMNGQMHFTDVSAFAQVQTPIFSFPTFFFDYDNDGWEDLLVCSYPNVYDKNLELELATEYLGIQAAKYPPILYHNTGLGTFEQVGTSVGLDRSVVAMGLNYGDLNNDGYLDLYFGTGHPDLRFLVPNLLLLNQAGHFFEDHTLTSGLGHLQKTHGISMVDFDSDGDLDIYCSIGGFYESDVYQNCLFENQGNNNHWIKISLKGTKSNRFGLHSRIRLGVRDSEGASQIFRTVQTGGSFGASPVLQHIGLGNADQIDFIEVYWPASGTLDRSGPMDVNQTLLVKEGEGFYPG